MVVFSRTLLWGALALQCGRLALCARNLIVIGASVSDDGTGWYPRQLAALQATFEQRLPPAEARVQALRFVQPADPYVSGRFTNGLTPPMYIAKELKFDLVNYAVGGAGTGGQTVVPLWYPPISRMYTQTALDKAFGPGQYRFPGQPDSTMLQQADQYIAEHGPALDPTDTLYLSFDASDNDIYSLLIFQPAATPAQETAFVAQVVAATRQLLDKLYAAGARRFAIVSSPDLSQTPIVRKLGPAAQAQSLRVQKQLEAAQEAAAREFKSRCTDTKTSIFFFRQTSDVLTAVIDALNLADTVDPCYPASLVGVARPDISPCPNPTKYLYWDDIHPTTSTAALIANAIIAFGPQTLLLPALPALG